MAGRASWIVLSLILVSLVGGCTAMAGGVDHWPAIAIAAAAIVLGKIGNDRWKIVKWPSEFLFWAAITMIVCNLVFLYVTA